MHGMSAEKENKNQVSLVSTTITITTAHITPGCNTD